MLATASMNMNVSAKGSGMGKAMCSPRPLGTIAPVVRNAHPVPAQGMRTLVGRLNTERPVSTAQSIAGERSTSAPAAARPTEWLQKVIQLPPYDRGCHVITRTIYNALPEINEFDVGIANLFVMHTSASLTINENASPDVPPDLNDALDRLAPERAPYRHTDEGPDDMPAHVKSSLMGASLMLPISHGRFGMGTWQGIYLNEHRNYGGSRRIMITIQGQKRADGRKYPGSVW
ncbi:hypothetical protein DUNSADRAFT_5729 [Dunaliella salina]|uniref:Secondary thiamine-phosphate synthase enzyme n=1 Tax=Dunaliella salina TaxID=3046 RepID=A0ABQ7GPP0_DUNSA|nr:hypothetical protein DUNSADRAFT_5729 [Dunaliella salina]|eukprot:KAF5836576.1 hypothetical protein DUNSADRAFT_5729 [Dunaliella salina]